MRLWPTEIGGGVRGRALRRVCAVDGVAHRGVRRGADRDTRRGGVGAARRREGGRLEGIPDRLADESDADQRRAWIVEADIDAEGEGWRDGTRVEHGTVAVVLDRASDDADPEPVSRRITLRRPTVVARLVDLERSAGVHEQRVVDIGVGRARIPLAEPDRPVSARLAHDELDVAGVDRPGRHEARVPGRRRRALAQRRRCRLEPDRVRPDKVAYVHVGDGGRGRVERGLAVQWIDRPGRARVENAAVAQIANAPFVDLHADAIAVRVGAELASGGAQLEDFEATRGAEVDREVDIGVGGCGARPCLQAHGAPSVRLNGRELDEPVTALDLAGCRCTRIPAIRRRLRQAVPGDGHARLVGPDQRLENDVRESRRGRVQRGVDPERIRRRDAARVQGRRVPEVLDDAVPHFDAEAIAGRVGSERPA